MFDKTQFFADVLEVLQKSRPFAVEVTDVECEIGYSTCEEGTCDYENGVIRVSYVDDNGHPKTHDFHSFAELMGEFA